MSLTDEYIKDFKSGMIHRELAKKYNITEGYSSKKASLLITQGKLVSRNTPKEIDLNREERIVIEPIPKKPIEIQVAPKREPITSTVNNIKDMRRIIGIWDDHNPMIIPQKANLQLIKDIQPTHLINGGDALHLSYLRAIANAKGRVSLSIEEWNKIQSALKEDYRSYNVILDGRDAAVPENCEKTLLIGNHDYYLEILSKKCPDIEIFDYKKHLRLKERGYRVVPLNKEHTIGKLYFVHGIYFLDHHAKKTASVYHRNIRYGHKHDVQEYTTTTPLGQWDAYNAKSCGCNCDTNPDYIRAKPNAWTHAVYLAYVWPDGSFSDYVIKSVSGKFVYGNRIYGI